jgi:hypothetical protein
VNLIYAAYYYYKDPKKIIDSLTDGLRPNRIEVDSIDFEGLFFEDLDDRAINLHLIRSWKTRAIMFTPDGDVAVPAEMLYKKNVLTIRGSFKPVTNLNVDMIEQGKTSFYTQDDVHADNTVVIAEISLNDQQGHDANVPEKDIITRVRLLNSLGYNVMVSDYTRYFSLRAYFRQYTQLQIGIVVGIVNVRQIFDHDTYRGVEGGILEGFGKLFPDHTRMYVYPERSESGDLVDYTQVDLPNNLRHLYQHLVENKFITGIECSDSDLFSIYSREVLKKIAAGRGDWEQCLPKDVTAAIIEQKLFGFKA